MTHSPLAMTYMALSHIETFGEMVESSNPGQVVACLQECKGLYDLKAMNELARIESYHDINIENLKIRLRLEMIMTMKGIFSSQIFVSAELIYWYTYDSFWWYMH